MHMYRILKPVCVCLFEYECIYGMNDLDSNVYQTQANQKKCIQEGSTQFLVGTLLVSVVYWCVV